MNATPAPDGRPDPHAPGACATGTSSVTEPETVPRQLGGRPKAERLHGATADLLEHPDPRTAAQVAAIENLLRCWVREAGLTAPDHGTLRIPLPAAGTALLVPIQYWSTTGWHRFGLPYLEDGPEAALPVDAVTLAVLLSRETATGGDGAAHGGAADDGAADNGAVDAGSADEGTAGSAADTARIPADTGAHGPPLTHTAPTPGGDLAVRVADSVRRTATFLADRRHRPADGTDLFLSAEQSLLLGHPLHPTPKSREDLSAAESALYSPELRGSFPLHWLAVAPSLRASDSAWTERGRTVPAEHLTARLAGADLPLPAGYAALPMHPWQLRDITHRAENAALFDAGLLRDLGPHGAAWYPTSSVRTLYRPGAPAMLKLSLGLRITNSRRENLRKELHRGVEVHRLLRTGLAGRWQAAHPGFDIVRDPAWLAVDGPDGAPLPGLDVMIRHNPFAPGDDATCVAGLVSPRPSAPFPTPAPALSDTPFPSHGPMRSRLAETVIRLAGRTGRPRGAVAAEWFLRYLQYVVRPVLWLDSEAGIALEAHQQNTLLMLDRDGWPVGGRYRDNQGYYFRESRRADLERQLPGIGSRSDTFVSDEVTDERFAYYLAINNVLGLIGAFGSQRLADEGLLLAAFRRFLTDAATGPNSLRSPLPAHLLDSPALRCKANLLTRIHGLDELIGPVDTQSVYVTISNPLHS
ncbi:IucA/IucC family protein [Streptomyces sp. NPDC058001]|uniref:IucA/IucC family protein n=1 Tax=Streptomyces sp. NPDC058001 TaxID=3346300 RepID=UPI0036F12AD9